MGLTQNLPDVGNLFSVRPRARGKPYCRRCQGGFICPPRRSPLKQHEAGYVSAIEAARRAKLKETRIILQDLDDDAMVRLMGRENLDDYNADFFVMFETWESTKKYLRGNPPPVVTGGNETPEKTKKISEERKIATLLGG